MFSFPCYFFVFFLSDCLQLGLEFYRIEGKKICDHERSVYDLRRFFTVKGHIKKLDKSHGKCLNNDKFIFYLFNKELKYLFSNSHYLLSAI